MKVKLKARGNKLWEVMSETQNKKCYWLKRGKKVCIVLKENTISEEVDNGKR